MNIETGTWVLVADGEKYLLLRNIGDAELIDLRVMRHEEQDNPPTREQGADRPGRLGDPGGRGRSAVEETDWNRLEKERFAKDLAEQLRVWALANRFPRLVVVADPRTLGVLRPEFHKAVTERLVAEIDKDLTGAPISEIEASLKAA
ncbi:MAG: Host attachment protein [Rhodovulum sulfidophilum]|uniref:Host attachment protein n=1 Tax=Rhodovulum sulfidophilum TaxID=35806 RepID=A0A2W5NB84_RHOSU|nr:MAG: Host attachment protein [Rhodovulum sulfidophilum]